MSNRSARGRRRKKKASPVPALISAVILILIIAATAFFYNKYASSGNEMDASEYFALSGSGEAAVVVNDELLESKGRLIGEELYLDYQTVWSYLNSGYYWEEDSQTMLLTLPSGTQKWTPDDGTGVLTVENGVPYLSVESVKECSDIDLNVFEEPSRIVARTEWDGVRTGIVTSDSVIRFRGGPKSDIVREVGKDETVVVREEFENWTQVSTEDGFSGYIRNKDLEINEKTGLEHTANQELDFPKILEDHKIIMAWHYASKKLDAAAFQKAAAGAEGLNVISPMWFHPGTEKGDLKSFADKGYADAAHEAGLKVWAWFGDVESPNIDISVLFASEEARSRVIEQLLAAAEETGIDGFNLDFESVRESSAPQYLQFIRELALAAHEKGLVLSVDNYVPLFTPYFKRAEQAKYADYIVIMTYDEHTLQSGEAGPVASLPFVEKGITDTLAEVPAEQVIGCVPFYTRGWKEPFGTTSVECETLGMDKADEFVRKHKIELYYDQKAGENTGSSEAQDGRYSIWLEDEDALKAKLELFRKYDLAGVSAWRLGYERPSVWPVMSGYIAS